MILLTIIHLFISEVERVRSYLTRANLMFIHNVPITRTLDVLVHFRDNEAPVLLESVPLLLVQEQLFVYLLLVANSLL